MNRRHLATLALLALTSSASHAALFINEVLFNAPGTDAPNEYLEIRGTAGDSLINKYLIGVEGDTTGAGDIQTIFDLSSHSLGTNGFLTFRQSGNSYSVNGAATNVVGTTTGFGGIPGFSADAAATDIENASVTFMLISVGASGIAPSLTQDLDTDNNGLDALPTDWTILDSIGILDNASDRGYGSLVFSSVGGLSDTGVTIVNPGEGLTPEYMARVGDSTGFTAADWMLAELAGTAPGYTSISGASYNVASGTTLTTTLGTTNIIPEPGTATLLLGGTLAAAFMRRRTGRQA
jgi:hypothetical protein